MSQLTIASPLSLGALGKGAKRLNGIHKKEANSTIALAQEHIDNGGTLEEIAATLQVKPRLLRRLMNKHQARKVTPDAPALETKEIEMAGKSAMHKVGKSAREVTVIIRDDSPLFKHQDKGCFIEFAEDHVMLHFGHERARKGYVRLKGEGTTQQTAWVIQIGPKFIAGAEEHVDFRTAEVELIAVEDDHAMLAFPDQLKKPFTKHRPLGIVTKGGQKTYSPCKSEAVHYAPTPPTEAPAAAPVAPPEPKPITPPAIPSEADELKKCIAALNKAHGTGALRMTLDAHGFLHGYARQIIEHEL